MKDYLFTREELIEYYSNEIKNMQIELNKFEANTEMFNIRYLDLLSTKRFLEMLEVKKAYKQK